jgi:hypothetical protein
LFTAPMPHTAPEAPAISSMLTRALGKWLVMLVCLQGEVSTGFEVSLSMLNRKLQPCYPDGTTELS